MKRMFLFVFFFTAIITIDSICDCVRQYGGIASIERRGKGTLVLCGSCDSLLCKETYSDGSLKLGDWCDIWIPTDPLNPFVTGTGYNKAVFQGYPTLNDPTSGINFDVEPYTTTTYNYTYWLSHCGNY